MEPARRFKTGCASVKREASTDCVYCGKAIVASIPIISTTTNNSIKVNARFMSILNKKSRYKSKVKNKYKCRGARTARKPERRKCQDKTLQIWPYLHFLPGDSVLVYISPGKNANKAKFEVAFPIPRPKNCQRLLSIYHK